MTNSDMEQQEQNPDTAGYQFQTIRWMEADGIGPIAENTIADFGQGQILVVKGLNGQGKSWFGEMLMNIIRDNLGPNLLNEGSEAGFYRAILSEGHEILLTVNKNEGHKIEVKLPGQRKMTQVQRRAFMSSLLKVKKGGFDLNAYMVNTEAKKRSAMLAKLVGIDFSEINQQIQQETDKRQALNHEKTRIRNRIDFDTPDAVLRARASEPMPDATEISKEIEAMQADNQAHKDQLRNATDAEDAASHRLSSIRTMRDTIKKLQEQINELEGKITEEEFQIEKLNERAEKIREDAGEMTVWTEEDIAVKRDEMANIQEEYKGWIKSREQVALLDQVEKAEEDYRVQDLVVKRLEEKKMKMASDANDIPGLSFTLEGDAMYNGRRLEDMSTGEQALFGISIKKRELGALKYMHIDAHSLDGVNIRRVATELKKEGYNVLFELPEQESEEKGLNITMMMI